MKIVPLVEESLTIAEEDPSLRSRMTNVLRSLPTFLRERLEKLLVNLNFLYIITIYYKSRRMGLRSTPIFFRMGKKNCSPYASTQFHCLPFTGPTLEKGT